MKCGPWQRGSNENSNGLLPQYFPEAIHLNACSPEGLEHVAQELNAGPRKTLDWDIPADRLRDLLIASQARVLQRPLEFKGTVRVIGH